MQIHELNTFTGTPGQTDYLAIDSGQETCKIPAGNLGVTDNMTLAEAKAGTETGSRVIQPSVFKQAVSELSDILIVSVSSFSSLPKTVSNAPRENARKNAVESTRLAFWSSPAPSKREM